MGPKSAGHVSLYLKFELFNCLPDLTLEIKFFCILDMLTRPRLGGQISINTKD